jgi:hypothetical protein
VSDVDQSRPNHSLPHVEFQSWASFHAFHFWAQSLEFPMKELSCTDLWKVVCDRFERDHHNQLLRQFFHIRRHDSFGDFHHKQIHRWFRMCLVAWIALDGMGPSMDDVCLVGRSLE